MLECDLLAAQAIVHAIDLAHTPDSDERNDLVGT